MRQYTDEQTAVIQADGNYIIVDAGAGSGKTSVVIERAVRRAGEGARCLISTFSVMARQEIYQRLKKHPDVLSGKISMDRFSVMTSGGIAWRIVQEQNPSFKLMKQNETVRVLKKLLGQLEIHADEMDDILDSEAVNEARKEKLLSYYVNAIGLLVINDTPIDDPDLEMYVPVEVRNLFGLWKEHVASHNAGDISEMQALALKYLREGTVSDAWNYDEVIGDEAQDFSEIQFETMRNLAKKSNGSLLMVGDPAQAIYSWRGAIPGLLTPLFGHPDGTQFLSLSQNFRSTKQILAPALKMVNTIPGMNKRAVTQVSGEPVFLKGFLNRKKEAEYIADRCEAIMMAGSVPLDDVAIMARNHYALQDIFSTLSKKNIPFVYIGNKFFSRPEFVILDSAVSFLCQDNVKENLERIVKVYLDKKVDVDPMQEEDILEQVRGQVRKSIPLERLIKALSLARHRFADTSKNFGFQFSEFIEDMHLFDQVSKKKEGKQAAHTLSDLREMASWYGDIQSFQIGLIERKHTGQSQSPVPGHVFVGTPFAAKGKEFHEVFIAGMNDGTFPSPMMREPSMDYRYDVERSGGYDEEKRILFVAITRAKRACTLTFAKKIVYPPQSIEPSPLLHLTGLRIPR